MAILSVQHEQMTHTAHFSRPVFDLWGNGRTILNGVYNAFRTLGASVSNIKAEGSNPSDQRVSVALPNGVSYVFRFDRVETTFLNPTQALFDNASEILTGALAWIREASPQTQVAVHNFVHFTHSNLQGETLQDVLSRIGPEAPRSGGQPLGNGAIFHWVVPEQKWITQLNIDKSVAVPNGLFVMLSITISVDKIQFMSVLERGRAYLIGLLDELSLDVPDFK
jgi:hypothetical protein